MDLLHKTLSDIATLSRSTAEVETGFLEAAKLILLDYQLIAGEESFEILELEFYFYQKQIHPDPYSHAFQYPKRVIPKMSVTGSWYFHRFIGVEKYTHTRRGLDLTYGSAEHEAYGGLLIRSVKRESDGKRVSGPSNVVAYVLEAADNPEGVQHLAFNRDEGMAFREDSIIRFSPRNKPLFKAVYQTSRHGLGDKMPLFRDKEYRYFTDASVLKKRPKKNLKKEIISA